METNKNHLGSLICGLSFPLVTLLDDNKNISLLIRLINRGVRRNCRESLKTCSQQGGNFKGTHLKSTKIFKWLLRNGMGFPHGSVISLPANGGVAGDAGSISRPGRSSGGGYGNPLQYSFLENSMDRGAWRVTVYSDVKSWTRLK